MPYTYTELLDSLKVRGMMPTNQDTFTEARFLVGLNDAMRTKVLPFLNKLRENYYSYDVDTSVTASGEYPIPSRAIGAALQNVALINGTDRLDVSWISEEEQFDTGEAPDGTIVGGYIKGNIFYLKPADGEGYATLRQTILLRPCEVIANSDAAQITAINTGTKTLTFATGTIPSTFTTSELYELVQADPHFDTLGFDLVVTSVTATTVVFSATLPTRLAVGDWVGLSGQSPVIQCPLELHPYLAQEAANYCLRGQVDNEAYKAGLEEADRLRKDLETLFTPRIQKEGRKIVNRTRILRRGW